MPYTYLRILSLSTGLVLPQGGCGLGTRLAMLHYCTYTYLCAIIHIHVPYQHTHLQLLGLATMAIGIWAKVSHTFIMAHLHIHVPYYPGQVSMYQIQGVNVSVSIQMYAIFILNKRPCGLK